MNRRAIIEVYDALRESEPFRRWILPQSKDMLFKTESLKHWNGYTHKPGKKTIISISTTIDPFILDMVVGHEMVHIACDNVSSGNGVHDARFKRKARNVCKHHGFVFEDFMFSD